MGSTPGNPPPNDPNSQSGSGSGSSGGSGSGSSGSGSSSGSGAGSSPPAFTPWNQPTPQTVLGVNSSTVYGENVQSVAGANIAITFGSNSQFVINPFTLIGQGFELPPGLNAFAGGGTGGNLSFTLGANASITMGPQIEVVWGGKKSLEVGETAQGGAPAYRADTVIKTTNKVFGILISGLVVAWFVGYGVIDDQNDRASLLVALQTTLAVVVSVMLGIDMTFDKTQDFLSDALKELFQINQNNASTMNAAQKYGKGVVSALACLVEAGIMPAVVESSRESHFHAGYFEQS